MSEGCEDAKNFFRGEDVQTAALFKLCLQVDELSRRIIWLFWLNCLIGGLIIGRYLTN